MKYPNLFSPIKIGPLTLKSRLVSAPTEIGRTTPEGYPTKDIVAYFKLKAKGGTSLITLGDSAVDDVYARTHPNQIVLDDEAILPSLAELADAIKQHGAAASIELNHAGREGNPAFIGGKNPIGPSACAYPVKTFHEGPGPGTVAVTEMDERLIEEAVESYANAALLVKRAGFDMCMLHGGHGWLLAQFLSPLSNKRTDKYGGSFENRVRFPLAVIDRVRERVGYGFPIEYRLSGSELVEGGLTLDDAIAFAKLIQNKVDLIHVSAGTFAAEETITFMHSSSFLPHGCSVYLAEAIKKAVSIPVAAVGSISDPEMAEQIIAAGKADIVAMARALIADPELPKKARSGRREEIVPCTRCLSCLGELMTTGFLKCAVNPVAGREILCGWIMPAEKTRKVLIAGGGPAGLQAAITAAARGHAVTLCEKSSRLGGKLKHLDAVSFKEDLIRFRDYQIGRVNDLAVKVRLNTEVTPDLVKETAPDVLIAAVGAEPIIPDIPGITHPSVLPVTDIYRENVETGKKVVIIGGGMVGCETALFLAQRGKEVTIVEMAAKVAPDANLMHRKALMELLEKCVTIKTGLRCTGISEDSSVRAVDNEAQECIIKADTVLIAAGFAPHTLSLAGMGDLAQEFYSIGDCVKPQKVLEAVRSGFNAAIDI